MDQSDDRESVARFIDDGRGLIVTPRRSRHLRAASQFANPWHDEVGRFAPKGTGKKYGHGPDEDDSRPGLDERHDLDPPAMTEAERLAKKRYDSAYVFETMQIEEAQDLAVEKAKNVPKPTEDDVIQGQVDALLAREGLVRAGGDRRGNNTARKRRAKQLAKEFGDGTTCPCVDCGQALAADAETAEKLGLDALTQDKILVGTLGGSYKLENLVPSCPPCNQSRGDREGVGVVGDVRQKWGSAERFTRQVVRDNGEAIAQRFQLRRKAIMKRKGISWEEHLAKNPDALPQDWEKLRRPVGGNFSIGWTPGEIIAEMLDGVLVDGDAADHELGVDDPVRVDIPGEEFALDRGVVDGVVEALGIIPPEPLGPDHRAVLKNHRHHRSEFINPWHDEIGRFAPKGTGRNFGDVVRNGREPTDLEAVLENPPQELIDAVNNYVQYIKYGHILDDYPREAKVAYQQLEDLIGDMSYRRDRLFPVGMDVEDQHNVKLTLIQRAGREKYLRQALLEMAADTGQTPDAIEAQITNHLRNTLKDLPVSTRVTDSTLQQILDDGHIRSQFETGTSNGSLGRDSRAIAERDLFGLDPRQTPDRDRPIYGYMPLNPNDALAAERGLTLDQYGGVRIEFDDAVRARTTFTVGDSLAGTARPSPVNDPSFDSVGYRVNDLEVAAKLGPHYEEEHPDWQTNMRTRGYVEAQIHGGLTTNDIKRIVFDTPPQDALTRRLEDLGIAWAVVDERVEQPLAAAGPPSLIPEGIPLFRDSEGAVIYSADPDPDLPDVPMGYIHRDGYIYAPRPLLALLAHGRWIPVGTVASAAQFGNPWHDEIGRFAEKGVGTNYADIANRARQAEEAGSRISELDGPQSVVHGRRLLEMVRTMGEDFGRDHGVRLTTTALNQRHGRGRMNGLVATNADGLVLGAIAYTKNPGDYHIEFLGSTGLVKGVGSQLVIPVMERAAADGAKVTLLAAPTSTSAGPFWESVGFEGPGAHREMVPADVKAWVANITRERDREPALVAAGPPPEGWDPDDDRWAAHAIELGLMTIVASAAEFANPWHDEIGRFAPKGTGRRFGKHVSWHVGSDGYMVMHNGEYTRAPEAIKHYGALEVAEHMTPLEARQLREELEGQKFGDPFDGTDVVYKASGSLATLLHRPELEGKEGFDHLVATGKFIKDLDLGLAMQLYAAEQFASWKDSGVDIAPLKAATQAHMRGEIDAVTLSQMVSDNYGITVESGAVGWFNRAWQISAVSHESTAMQLQIAELRGLDAADKAMRQYVHEPTLSKASDLTWSLGATINAVTEAHQRNTQEKLSQAPELALPRIHRGLKGDQFIDIQAGDIVQSNPLSSWSFDPAQAEHFATNFVGTNGIVITADFDPANVLTISDISGMGSLDEREVIMIGQPITVTRSEVHRSRQAAAVTAVKVYLVDTPDNVDWITREPLVASGRRFAFASPDFEFANPWHDEIGRFAPKGTGTRSAGIPTEAKLTIDDEEADAEFEEEYGNERPSGDGDCFPTALHYVYSLPDEERKSHRIVHGVPEGQGEIEGLRFDHAWVERTDPLPENLPPEQRAMFEQWQMNVIVIDKSNGNDVEMPRMLYYQLGNIKERDVHRYTFDEAAAHAVRTGHYGPWT